MSHRKIYPRFNYFGNYYENGFIRELWRLLEYLDLWLRLTAAAIFREQRKTVVQHKQIKMMTQRRNAYCWG